MRIIKINTVPADAGAAQKQTRCFVRKPIAEGVRPYTERYEEEGFDNRRLL